MKNSKPITGREKKKIDIEITLYAEVDEDFNLLSFWGLLQGYFPNMKIWNPSYRKLKKNKVTELIKNL